MLGLCVYSAIRGNRMSHFETGGIFTSQKGKPLYMIEGVLSNYYIGGFDEPFSSVRYGWSSRIQKNASPVFYSVSSRDVWVEILEEGGAQDKMNAQKYKYKYDIIKSEPDLYSCVGLGFPLQWVYIHNYVNYTNGLPSGKVASYGDSISVKPYKAITSMISIAMLIWALLYGRRTVLIIYRIKKSACIKCGYVLISGACMCPECGSVSIYSTPASGS
jgi:hypothetical protein